MYQSHFIESIGSLQDMWETVECDQITKMNIMRRLDEVNGVRTFVRTRRETSNNDWMKYAWMESVVNITNCMNDVDKWLVICITTAISDAILHLRPFDTARLNHWPISTSTICSCECVCVCRCRCHRMTFVWCECDLVNWMNTNVQYIVVH